MFTVITRKNLNQEITARITESILNGKLKPGEKLPPERELAALMNVNRNTLREGLRKLEILGLLNIRQGDGIYIKDYRDCGNLELLKILLRSQGSLSPVILKGILEIRRIVIPEMAALAAVNANDEELRKIKDILETNSITIAEQDLAIHRVIASASGNLFYSFFLNFFNDTFMEYSHLYFSDINNAEKSSRFHKQIFNALKKNDSLKCRKLMLDILLYAEHQTLKNLELTHD